ncbi:oxygen-regulated protein 1-like [Sebastes umbrosus]|uniref:oxygen-regulated protein 1-like n=1 Tax=Sebastes umbrosus TaxID=72105 RepID=UPI00189DE68E|nr:oxygen-regulated protein 1-like [Sebastes umbrosus]
MMNEPGFRRVLPEQSLGSGHTFGTPRHPGINDPILSKRVCFYKSGDPQFNGLRMVINNRTFKTFDALLDSLSKKVPLPFGVRNITTPRGVHAVYTLDELEDGKSYICSDSRKVKPINLALARKKLPPWYNARPPSSRRRTVQKARFFPGKNIHKQKPALVRTPKRLLVFRNGEPTVKHSVVLHKRTTTTFESVLEYISEQIQFYVVKLHTTDGRRVDGLPGLILCSGTVVAVGMEPFKHANYNTQKSPASATHPTKQSGHRRLKRKKKSRSYTSKPRNFSPSSERYIVNRIHNSIAESSCDLPGHSIELESGRMLESVPETPETCLGVGAEGQDGFLPAEDDIEKSFRVNQDGSMTVEMRVRLTIKEEETIHWTTTLARSSVANQLNVTHLSEPESNSLKSDSLDLQSPVASIDSINKDKTRDNNDEDPPSLSNEVFSENSHEEGDVKVQTDVVSPRRPPTPGHKQIRKKQASVESIKSVTAEGIQEGMVGSYSYREQTENGAVTEQYCMVKQSSRKPVPKPRRLGSVDGNNISNVSTFKSAEMTEVLQIESSGDEVTETVLHVYEQQICQDNFFANLSGIPFCRPATSETGQLSSSNEFEPQLWRPSTASESVSVWRAESRSVTSDSTSPSQRHQRFPKPTKGKDKPQPREVNKDKRVSSKPKVINKRVRRLTSPGKRRKNSAGATEKNKKVKTFSSAGFIKRIYGSKSKSAKSMMKIKKGRTQNGDGGVTTKSSQQSDDECILKDPNTPSALKETTSETVSSEKSSLNVAPNEVSQPRGILTRQTSMHREKKNKSYDVSGSMSLPPVNSSSSVTNEYVENWLEKIHLNPTAYSDEENRQLQALGQTENGRCGESENKKGVMIVADEVKEDTALKTDLLLERGASVKQRIKSFENKSSGPPMEKTTVKQQIAKSQTTTTNTENSNSLAQINTDEVKPLCSEIIPPTNGTPTEMPSDSENKSSQIKISFQNATPSITLSMELPLPPPPPPDENTELSITEYNMMEAPSVASSPLYRLSSVSSETSDHHPLSISPTSDKAASPTDHTTEMTTSIQSDIPSTQREAPLPRTPSIKRAPLVSNTSLDKNMSLRKACLDKYTLCSDATSETSTSSTSINIAGDNVLSNGICSIGTYRSSETPPEENYSMLNMKSSPSCCTSASPTSSASEKRISPGSILSSEAPTPRDLPFKETKTPILTQKESPKPLVKNVKLMSSPSKKLSSEIPHNSPKLSSLHNHPQDKTTSPNIGKQRHGTPYASPNTERKLYRPKSQKRRSPYSQSLDMVSPPVRHKSSGRSLSSDDALEPTSKTQRKTSSQRKHRQTPQSIESTAELDKTLICKALMPLEAELSDDNKVPDQEKSITQIIPQPLNIANQPNMKPVLEKICYSIKSIRRITQNKRPSCLEKSNSLPDFSSHVASTFGSSSKALLAFLSVMTLKEGLTNQNMDELNANNVSCAEALKMIDSLTEIASMEDSHELKVSLANLQQSASMQLLQSWKGFQDLGDKCKSRSSTPKHSEQEAETSSENDCGIDENVFDEILDNLDIPEQLKDELTSLSAGVRSDSDNEEKIEKVEPKDAKKSNFFAKDAAKVRDVTQDEKVDVSSIIKKFTDINQPKQPSITKDTKEKDSLNGQNGVAKCPPAEPIDKPEERQLYSTVMFEKDDGQQGHIEEKSNQENAKMNRVVSSKKSLEQDSCTSEAEEQDMEGNQLHCEENELTHDDESGSDEEGQNKSSGTKDLEQNESCKQSVSEADQQHSSEEEPEVEIQQETRESEDLSNPESHSEEEEVKKPSSDYYVEVNVRGKERISSPDSQHKSLSEEDEPEVECEASCTGTSVDESTSDVDDPSSDEEQSEVGCKKLKVIIEETSSGNEEEEEEHHVHLLDHRHHIKKGLSLINETEEEEDIVSSDNEDRHEEGDRSNLIENQDSYTKKDNRSLTKSYGFSADEDSGNDHSSCDEHVEVEQAKFEDEQINNSSYNEKESSSEDEHANMDRYIEEPEYQEAPALVTQSKDTKCEKAVEKQKHQSQEMISQSVAERVILLDKKVADAQKTTGSSAIRRSSQRSTPLESDVEGSPSESPTSQSASGTRSAPQSSLSFSYDSSGVITTEPEGNRVRSIREMFLAKSATEIQHGRFPSPNASKRTELRAETSASGGYQSQTSGELSSGEDDSARKSITKGLVRRTIERLYGKKDAEEASERPPSAPKEKKKENTSIFSPFHIAKAIELSYFNSTNAMDTARCAAFNVQVGPEDSVPVGDEQWLLRENALIRKSVSDPVGINKNLSNSPQGGSMCDDTQEDAPYSLFSSKSEVEDKKASFSRKCTYFSLPHASDSEACQDEINTVANSDSITDTKDDPEDTKTWAERNGKLPGAGVTDFKMKDNKVHPLVEPAPDGEVVVVQPVKGQGVMARRMQEPDMLDIIYNFCGQNCPIL